MRRSAKIKNRIYIARRRQLTGGLKPTKYSRGYRRPALLKGKSLRWTSLVGYRPLDPVMRISRDFFVNTIGLGTSYVFTKSSIDDHLVDSTRYAIETKKDEIKKCLTSTGFSTETITE